MLLCCVTIFLPRDAGGDDLLLSLSQEAAPAAADSAQVAATVDGLPIYQYEVERIVRRTFGDRELAPRSVATLQAAALEQLINQRLIVQWCRQRNRFASDVDFQLAHARMLKSLSDRGTTLPDYLRQSRRTEAELIHSLWWELVWNAMLDHYVTEDNLQRHFDRQPHEFDGTQLHVAQILWKLPEEPSAVESIRREAAALRERIAAGEISFGEAASEHSQAPSAADQGDIGWIERHKPMTEAFSRAAFELKTAEISQPVESTLGIHLIQLLEVKPGTRTWQEARSQLEQSLTQYLFQWAADQQRPNSTIERNLPGR